MGTAALEGLKEVFRKVILAVMAILLIQLQSPNSNIDIKAVAVAGLIALLSGLDNWLSAKEVGINKSGITGV